MKTDLRSPNWSRDGHGAFRGTKTPESPPLRQSDFSTMLSVRYVSTPAFSAGILRTIMQRPADCTCTWSPVMGTEGFYGTLFDLKYPHGACPHHRNLVRGRMR